jgi:radical SAM protein with 4Fe4S-binding SPASM domain
MADFTWEQVLRIARLCRKVILVGYGEPFTNPRVIDLLTELDANGIDVTVSTNGLTISSSIATRLNALRHIVHFNVSLDTSDPETYRSVRGGNFDRVLRGLRVLVDAFDNPHRITVSAVAMRGTLTSLRRLPSLLASIGVHTLELQAVTDYNEFAAGEHLRGDTQLLSALQELRAECETHGVQLQLLGEDRILEQLDGEPGVRGRIAHSSQMPGQVTRQCALPWEIPFVDKDGRVFPCCYAAARNSSQLGQIGPDRFEQIWIGEQFRQFRKGLLHGDPPSICRDCTIAPLGPHPYLQWAAQVIPETITVSAGRASILATNLGTRTWTPDDNVRIGTSRPRDRRSNIRHDTWLSGNRPARCDAVVEPGEVATFSFWVSRQRWPVEEKFEILVEGRCWMPNTSFSLAIPAIGPLRRRLSRLRA